MVRNIGMADQLNAAHDDAEKRSKLADERFERAIRRLFLTACLYAIPAVIVEMFEIEALASIARTVSIVMVPVSAWVVANYFVRAVQGLKARRRLAEAEVQIVLFNDEL